MHLPADRLPVRVRLRDRRRPRLGAFFAQHAAASSQNLLYFSFATITTSGYGDLTAATDVGRSLAIAEALIGQIYLVTVVAAIVGGLGRRRRA